MQMACSASEERVAAPFLILLGVGVIVARLSAKAGTCTALQRFELFAWDLQPGEGGTLLLSRLRMRDVCHAMPRLGASLRAR